ncbi:MAG: ATP-binding protein [Pseudomonadota bacterium]
MEAGRLEPADKSDLSCCSFGLRAKTFLATMCFFLGMSLYQLFKYWINPEITLLQSNVATVVITTVAAFVAAFLALRRMHFLYRRTLEEAGRRLEVEMELRKAQDVLEAKIKERTNELTATNNMLQEEIIERRKAEKRLRDSENSYRTFLEETPVSITIFDEAGVVRFINRFHIKTFSRNKKQQSDFLGKKVFDLPGLVNAGVSGRMAEVLTGKTVDLNDVFTPEFSGGHSGFMNLRAVPMFDADRVSGGILIREDVTSRHKNEQELIRLNRTLETVSLCQQALVRATGERVMLQEVCRALVDKGQYHLAWVGLAQSGPEKLVLNVAHAGFEPNYLERQKVTWADDEFGRGAAGRAIRTGRPIYLEDLADAPDFSPWRSEALKRGLLSKVALPLVIDGVVIGALNIYKGKPGSFDPEEIGLLTKLAENLAYGMRARRMQAERARAREEQTKLESQLRQAQKMEAIGTLAGGIAHDFNNILGAMMGYTQLAMFDTPSDGKARNYLEQVMTAGSRASELVSQILTFSRQTESEKKPINLGPIVKEALKLLRASIPSTIEIRQDIANDAGITRADPTQIHQVLMNLCTNAAQAIGDKGGVISASLGEVAIDHVPASQFSNLTPGSWVRLKVEDDGGGIDPVLRDRVFEPYFTTKAAGEGTGLGLAAVHGIVKSHQGDIILDSEPGRGTSFSIFLPRCEGDIPENDDAQIGCPGGRERILFVDDEGPLVELGQKLLENLGYTVTGLTSSLLALELFRADPGGFDLVVTDLTMPRMNGLDLSAALTAIKPDIPIILCTGFSTRISKINLGGAGIRGLILKPMLLDEMARTIRTVLDSKPD